MTKFTDGTGVETDQDGMITFSPHGGVMLVDDEVWNKEYEAVAAELFVNQGRLLENQRMQMEILDSLEPLA